MLAESKRRLPINSSHAAKPGGPDVRLAANFAGTPSFNTTFFCDPGSITGCYWHNKAATGVTFANAQLACQAVGGGLVQYKSWGEQFMVEVGVIGWACLRPGGGGPFLCCHLATPICDALASWLHGTAFLTAVLLCKTDPADHRQLLAGDPARHCQRCLEVRIPTSELCSTESPMCHRV
jgi:hypothetical protein